ncbi:MAG: hypothetical protein H0T42_07845 [Deltaproteobacteria bacterium]|nr:hypothetical protein [Deltaproteobacteria bacterium]
MRLLVLLVLLSPSAYAEARKRVVVLALEGPKADAARTEVVRLIKRQHAVIKKGLWERAAKSKSAAKIDPKAIKRTAREMEVDAIVSGTVEKLKSTYRVRFQVRSGDTGEIIGQLRAAFDGSSFDRTARAVIRDDLVDLISNHRPSKAKNARRR